ncbi:MAG: Winged helix-turn helix [Pseudomonadota bacterium]
MSPPTSIALVSVCLQGLQPCFPSYAFSPHDACFGYVHVYVWITPSPTHSISQRPKIVTSSSVEMIAVISLENLYAHHADMSGGTISKEGLAALVELRSQTGDVAAYVRLTAVIAVYEGVSISELSRILGISRTSIYSWLRQHRRSRRADILLGHRGSGR